MGNRRKTTKRTLTSLLFSAVLVWCILDRRWMGGKGGRRGAERRVPIVVYAAQESFDCWFSVNTPSAKELRDIRYFQVIHDHKVQGPRTTSRDSVHRFLDSRNPNVETCYATSVSVNREIPMRMLMIERAIILG